MRIIDRYLLRQFIKAFMVCFVSLTGLYIVFDAFTNLEEFIRCGQKAGGFWPLLFSFYGYQSIMFFDRIGPLLTLVAAMFTVSWIQRNNEMVALMAAGITKIRVVAPVIVASILLALLAVANRELVIPRFRDELARRPQDILGDVGQEMQHRYDYETDILLRGEHTFIDRQRIEKPHFLLPRELRTYTKQLAAKDAFYMPPEGDRPGGYLLDQVEQPTNLPTRSSLYQAKRPVVIMPKDASWLKANQCFVVSNVTFEQLTGGRSFREFSSTSQLVTGLGNPSLGFGASVRTAIHVRLVKPLMDVTLLFLGLPLVVSRENRNVFVAIAACMGVTTLFMLVTIGCQHLGSSALIRADLAAWLPLILFIPPAAWLAESMWK